MSNKVELKLAAEIPPVKGEFNALLFVIAALDVKPAADIAPVAVIDWTLSLNWMNQSYSF